MNASAAKVLRETLNIRVRTEDRGLFDRAAQLRGKNRSEFILDAARRAAEEVLMGQSLMLVDEEAHRDFLAYLDGPAKPNAALRKTAQTNIPWAEED